MKPNMWSGRYYYFNIYKDENLSANCETRELLEFLNGIPELRQVGEYEFRNSESFPFTQLLLLNANSKDSWNKSDTNSRHSNLITIVCGKGESIDYQELKRIFVQIASFLNWKLVDEETDDGIEDVTMWEPKDEMNVEQGE